MFKHFKRVFSNTSTHAPSAPTGYSGGLQALHWMMAGGFLTSLGAVQYKQRFIDPLKENKTE